MSASFVSRLGIFETDIKIVYEIVISTCSPEIVLFFMCGSQTFQPWELLGASCQPISGQTF